MAVAPASAPTTLTEVLLRAGRDFPDRGVEIFDGRARRSERRSYPEVVETARRGAGRLLGRGVVPGDRVLVALPTSWEWMEAWLGGLLAGAWPVAVASPGSIGSAAAQVARVAAVARRLGARTVVATDGLARELRALPGDQRPEGVVTPGELAEPVAGLPSPPSADPEDVAFLQLTSGSTGLPRAVMIPHRAVIHNNLGSDRAIGAPFGEPASERIDTMVSWLPLYHDMGLVGCLWYSLLVGWELVLLDSRAFLARPLRWLEELGGRGRTLAPAPNFAFQLCLDRVAEGALEGMDLSGWEAALNGAEMIRPEVTEAFTERFGRYGFSSRAFRPCYGLAEAALAVTFDERGEGVRWRPPPPGVDETLAPSRVVSLGRPISGLEVTISGPGGAPRGEGEIGEIRVRGPSIFSGYFQDPEATAEGLIDGWLVTGDLGFLADGELYVTGRSKDILIVRGQNLMPHELEWIADAVTGGGGLQRSAAFSVARGPEGEVPVLAVECSQREGSVLATFEHEIRHRVGRELGLPLADVVFLRRGQIPKTTSGKVQRRELARRYLDQELDPLPTGD